MRKLALWSTVLLVLSAAPAAAANCYWANGVYRCTDSSGRTYVAKPRADQGTQKRRPQGKARAPAYVPPPDFGTGMGAFSYGCTLSRCD